MKILVTGAGIIGTTYGWALAAGGHHVVHFARPGKAARFRDGIPMDVFDKRKRHKRYYRGQYLISVTEVISPSDDYDLILVPTKHYQLEEALARLVPDSGSAGFLLLTQNWQGTAAADSILPRDRYVYGDAKAGGTYSAGTLVCTLASIDVGPADGSLTPLAQKVAALMESAAIPTKLHENMVHYLWVQYAITGGLWPALVRAGSFDAALRDRHAGETAMAAVRECLEVVARRGVDLHAYPETRSFLSSSTLRRTLVMWMFKLVMRYSEFVKRASAHALGDPKEIKVFYEDLTNTGHQLGVPMPEMDSYAADIARLIQRSD